jgi:hypothetical protein
MVPKPDPEVATPRAAPVLVGKNGRTTTGQRGHGQGMRDAHHHRKRLRMMHDEREMIGGGGGKSIREERRRDAFILSEAVRCSYQTRNPLLSTLLRVDSQTARRSITLCRGSVFTLPGTAVRAQLRRRLRGVLSLPAEHPQAPRGLGSATCAARCPHSSKTQA